MLRVIPFLPFWFSNIVPVLFGVRLKEFAISTLVGIFPGTYVATQVGVILNDELIRARSMGSIFDAQSGGSWGWRFFISQKKMFLPALIWVLWFSLLVIVRIRGVRMAERLFLARKSWVAVNDKYFE